MSTYTGVTDFQKQSGFLAHPVYMYSNYRKQIVIGLCDPFTPTIWALYSVAPRSGWGGSEIVFAERMKYYMFLDYGLGHVNCAHGNVVRYRM